MRTALHVLIVGLLGVLTQVGALAWLAVLPTRRRWLWFLPAYGGIWVATVFVAPLAGRVPLPCGGDGSLRSASLLYCAMNRHYVTPEVATLLHDLADEMDQQFPGTVTLTLDGSFPFFDGVPLLPHLSHDDGDKVDLAFWYADTDGYAPGQMRSPLGYFAFEDGPTDCPSNWLTLRWDLAWLQPLWADLSLDAPRMRHGLTWLANHPDTGKLFVEPHLQTALGVTHPKIRFQGCRAARHDDHIHLQL